MTTCRRCLICGRVQGVFFRAATAARARALGITGWAKNLPDGRVEVLACGPHESVAALVDWLRQGPAGARVESVQTDAAEEVEIPAGFKTG